MLPTLAISILPVTVGIEKLAMPIGKGFTLLFEVAKPVDLLIGFLLWEPVGPLINRHC